MVVLLVITMSITWAFQIFAVSTKVSTHTKNKIEAIQIAREWLEAFTNIRNTNWILFSADYKNCWNTLNYNKDCVAASAPATSTDIDSWSYIIYKNTDNRWFLEPKATGLFSEQTYRDNFKVQKDANTLYTQSWWTDFLPIFTREIQVTYINTAWPTPDSNDDKINIKSIVQWKDSSSNKPHKVKLETLISNWRYKN